MSQDNGVEIVFPAAVYKVQTLVDGGIRVILDLPETAILQAAALMECQRAGVTLVATCKTDGNKYDKVESRAKRKSKWQTPQESCMDGDS